MSIKMPSDVPGLAGALRDAVDRATEGEIVVSIHLFGIRHAAALGQVSVTEVVEAAGVRMSYSTEVRKGMKLADYVMLR